VIAPCRKIDHLAAVGSVHDTRGLGGDHGLEGKGGEQERLDDLCLDDRSGDAHQGRRGKRHRALGDGVDVAGEAQFGEIFEERGLEVAAALEVGEGLGREAQVIEVGERLLEAGDQQKAAVWRQAADVEVEGRNAIVHPLGEIARRHGELVEVGGQR